VSKGMKKVLEPAEKRTAQTKERRVRLDGVQCELTGYQFDLLVTLAKNAGRVLSRDALLFENSKHGGARTG